MFRKETRTWTTNRGGDLSSYYHVAGELDLWYKPITGELGEQEVRRYLDASAKLVKNKAIITFHVMSEYKFFSDTIPIDCDEIHRRELEEHAYTVESIMQADPNAFYLCENFAGIAHGSIHSESACKTLDNLLSWVLEHDSWIKYFFPHAKLKQQGTTV